MTILFGWSTWQHSAPWDGGSWEGTLKAFVLWIAPLWNFLALWSWMNSSKVATAIVWWEWSRQQIDFARGLLLICADVRHVMKLSIANAFRLEHL